MSALELFQELSKIWLPRILTQIDRDPTSSTYGCCDRNWWHYKIRDFPSIILQQAGYAAFICSEWSVWQGQRESLRAIAAASASFWSRHVARHKSFDEYYPFEKGYPPLAFSTLAVMKLAEQGVVPKESILPGARLAAKMLQHRFEARAANQQVAGMAALLWLERVFPQLIIETKISQIVAKTLALQTREGWFWEYDGPDLGYLSVTIDCLWDAWDARNDPRYRDAAIRAVQYIEVMTRLTGENIGMHNARNTDYIVPYGIVRMALEPVQERADAAWCLVQRLYSTNPKSRHDLYPTDDRYICHYIGASVFRAGLCLQTNRKIPEPTSSHPQAVAIEFPEAGHALTQRSLVSLKKGGIVTVFNDSQGAASDFGWTFKEQGKQYVSHWWSGNWQINRIEQGWRVAGPLVPCRELVSSPLKHIALRIISRLFGAGIIGHLKKTMIFRRHAGAYHFQRDIVWTNDGVKLTDTITPPPATPPQPAPRASRRHVASADSFHPEDFTLVELPWQVTRIIKQDKTRWVAETTYTSST